MDAAKTLTGQEASTMSATDLDSELRAAIEDAKTVQAGLIDKNEVSMWRSSHNK